MNTKELYQAICGDLTDRTEWEQRQATWYQMRHDGLRRANKPWPGAADMHFPLVDGMIEKWKPFYYQQLFSTETLAGFVARSHKLQGVAQELAYWFDYKLKQCTNLERESLVAIDRMLMTGHNVVKVHYDGRRKRLLFESVPAARIIVPWHTKELHEADRIVHVWEGSQEQYKANGNWRQDAEFVRTIKGRGVTAEQGDQEHEERLRREGLTVASSDELIVVWEIYSRDERGRWVVDTLAPVRPEEPVRGRIGLPFTHGIFREGLVAPFVRLDHEVKDNGHYSSRGLPEIAGAFETSLNRQWNAKHDYMSFANRPLFSSAQAVPNGANVRVAPGSILPFGVSPLVMAPPPVSIDQEMLSTRGIAEYRVGMPDYGLGQPMQVSEAKTATENRQRQALLNQGVDLKARCFRSSLSTLYRMAWALLLQYDKDAAYLHDGAQRKIDAGALADEWEIQPNGSSDSWNREARLQKAIARKQLLGGSPWINQAELDRSIIELDDPRLVARIFVDPEQKKASEYEEEAKLIPTILLGMPLSVRADQDAVVRCKCLMDFLEQRAAAGQPPDGIGLRAMLARLTMHVDAAGAANPALGKRLRAEVEHKLAVMSTAQEMAAELAGRMTGAGGPVKDGNDVRDVSRAAGAGELPEATA